jgi:general secretion pathway protein G
MKKTKKNGFSLIELLIVFGILAVLMLVALFAFQKQLVKGRDAKRKADLSNLQRVLEDYLNDEGCYPSTLECGQSLLPYMTSIPCDPVNNGQENIYSYFVPVGSSCAKCYKIFTTLEKKEDSAVEETGCLDNPNACGIFNYGVASPNAEVSDSQSCQ